MKGLTIRVGKSVVGYYTPLEAWLKNIGISGIFIVGPFLWFYGITLFYKSTLSRWHYLHLVPFTLFIALLAIIPANGKFETFWNDGLVAFHLGNYLILSWWVLSENDSNAFRNKYIWYRNILTGVTIVWVYYLGKLFNLKLQYIWGLIFYSFLIYAFSYLFLNRTNFNIEK